MSNGAIAYRRFGFTIVELLVIIVIIGILASLSVVGYTSWRTRAETTAVKSDLVMAANAMKQQRNFSNSYPLSLPASFSASPNITVTWSSGSATAFCITGSSKVQSSVTYYVTNTSSQPIAGACTVPAPATPVITSGSAVCANNGTGAASWASVTLTWNGEPASSVPTYRIYRGSTLASTYSNTGTTAGSRTTTVTSEQWPASSPYTLSYTIRAVNSAGAESPDSNVWSQSFPAYDC